MTKEQIIRRFNLGAKTYQSVIDIQSIAAQKLATYLNRPADQILEIGCGTGSFSQYLVNQFKDKPIYLTDISPEMIKISQERFSTCPYVNTACKDGENLSLNSAYDLIASNMALHWFENLFLGIQNILRYLSAGGSFIFTLLGKDSLKEWREICSASNYANTTLYFVTLEEISAYYPAMQFTAETHTINYPNVHSFLRTLRNIGGTASYTNARLATRELRSLLRQFEHSFQVTYEIIYGHYVKP
jgi:malonyl-CoA O-methyltransferase